MRQQFAGPLGSSAAMQMPALHFTLGPAAAAAVPGAGGSGGARGAGAGSGASACRMFRCRRRKLRALHKS